MAVITEDKIEEVSPPDSQSIASDDRNVASTPGHGESGNTAREKETVSLEETFEDAFSLEDLKKVPRADSRNIVRNLNPYMNLIARYILRV